AGEVQLKKSGSLTDIQNAVRAAAYDNSFTCSDDTSHTGGTATCTIHNPPTAGNYNGDSNSVEVIISQTQDNYFMSMIGLRTTVMGARAVGTLGPSSSLLVILDPNSDAGTLTVSGGSQICVGTVTSSGGACTAGGDVVVNSTNVGAVAADHPGNP